MQENVDADAEHFYWTKNMHRLEPNTLFKPFLKHLFHKSFLLSLRMFGWLHC